MLEITTFLMYCCLCVVIAGGTAGFICLTYVYISNMLKEHKRINKIKLD